MLLLLNHTLFNSACAALLLVDIFHFGLREKLLSPDTGSVRLKAFIIDSRCTALEFVF